MWHFVARFASQPHSPAPSCTFSCGRTRCDLFLDSSFPLTGGQGVTDSYPVIPTNKHGAQSTLSVEPFFLFGHFVARFGNNSAPRDHPRPQTCTQHNPC